MIEAEYTFSYDLKIDALNRVTETKIKVWLELDMESDFDGPDLSLIPKAFEVFIGDETLVDGEYKLMPALLKRWVENKLSGMKIEDFGLTNSDFEQEVFH